MESTTLSKLTKKDALDLVSKIDHMKDDDEVAHSEEDSLHWWFIECCAEGLYTKKEIIEIGKIVLSTKDLDFARWCA